MCFLPLQKSECKHFPRNCLDGIPDSFHGDNLCLALHIHAGFSNPNPFSRSKEGDKNGNQKYVSCSECM